MSAEKVWLANRYSAEKVLYLFVLSAEKVLHLHRNILNFKNEKTFV